jgi:hypothetical protein
MNWAANLDIDGIAGADGWRLPNANRNNDAVVWDCKVSGLSGCSDNEMGYLYWGEGITTSSLPTSSSPFTGVNAAPYWSSTDPDSSLAWRFNFTGGGQGNVAKTLTDTYAWAVHDDDFGTALVPLPAAAWLFGSGLLGLVGVARRKKAI